MAAFKTTLCFLAMIALTAAAFLKEANDPIVQLPNGYNDILSSDMLKEINQVQNNASLNINEKYDKIDKIILSAPESIIDKLPLPQGFNELPIDIQQKFQNVRKNATITWEEKQNMYKTMLKNLPEQYRHLIMPAFTSKKIYCLGRCCGRPLFSCRPW
uniref:Uncharacterized protein n=1 Tax=Panagrolaimus davidi TaxID=227884 RepID=A0A914QZ12_9BILA